MKNRTAYNFKKMKMNNDVYALRRKVINVIYELKKHVNLPRIEVRIVENGDWGVCGYAYLGKKIVHMNKKYCTITDDALFHLVAHEVVHAVAGFGHDDKCYLMHPHYKPKPIKSKSLEAFKKYF